MNGAPIGGGALVRLVKEIDPVNTAVAVELPGGPYLLHILADGVWTLRIG